MYKKAKNHISIFVNFRNNMSQSASLMKVKPQNHFCQFSHDEGNNFASFYAICSHCISSISSAMLLSLCPFGSPCSRLSLSVGPSCMISCAVCRFPDQEGLLCCCATVRCMDRNQVALLFSAIRIGVEYHGIWGWAHHKMGYRTISVREGKSPCVGPQGCGGCME